MPIDDVDCSRIASDLRLTRPKATYKTQPETTTLLKQITTTATTTMDVRCIYVYWEEELQRIRENDPDTVEFDLEGDIDEIQNITDEQWEELGRDISNNSHLTYLSLYDGALNDHRISCLFRGLTRSSSIKDMSLYNNQLSVNGVQNLVPFLQNANNLTKLDLDDNSNIRSEGFNVLLRALRDSSIEDLSCRICGINSIEIDTKHIPRQLKELHLEDNSINADGCRELAKFLQGGNSALEDLSLKNNQVDSDGVEVLAEALSINKSLTDLDVSNNKIGDDGVAALAAALQSNTALRALNLGKNKISDDGVTALVGALQSNATLNKLDLEGNGGISKRGKLSLLKLVIDISSIEATLQSNHTLTEINVTGKRPPYFFYKGNDIIQQLIDEAVNMNSRCWISSEVIGREKVRQIQMDGTKREQLADVQGVTHSVYSEIDSLYLPEVLALITNRHFGRRELFFALKSTIAGLLSRVDMKLCIQEQMARNKARVEKQVAHYEAKLTEHRDQIAHLESTIKAMTSEHESKMEALNARLAAMEDSDQEKNQDTRTQSNKRRRVD